MPQHILGHSGQKGPLQGGGGRVSTHLSERSYEPSGSQSSITFAHSRSNSGFPTLPREFTGVSLSGLAVVYARKGELEKADDYYARGMKLYAETLGSDSVFARLRREQFEAARRAAPHSEPGT